MQVSVVLEILQARKEAARKIALDSSGWRAGLVMIVVRELDDMTKSGFWKDLEERPTTDEVVEGIIKFRDDALAEEARRGFGG